MIEMQRTDLGYRRRFRLTRLSMSPFAMPTHMEWEDVKKLILKRIEQGATGGDLGVAHRGRVRPSLIRWQRVQPRWRRKR